MVLMYCDGLSEPLRQGLIPLLKAAELLETDVPESASLLLLGKESTLPDSLVACSWDKIVVLSSSQVYGEGDFHCGDCGPVTDPGRNVDHFKARRWEVQCPYCGEMLMPLPITEESLSFSKTEMGQAIRVFEQQVLAQPWSVPITILRLFSPYGPGMTFQDPEPFLSRLIRQFLAGETPELYEDGCQMRDFVYVTDVAQAIEQAFKAGSSMHTVMNIGSGCWRTVQEMAGYIQEFLHCEHLHYTVTDQYRPQDVRHRLADISKARTVLGYSPQVEMLDGLKAVCSAMLESVNA